MAGEGRFDGTGIAIDLVSQQQADIKAAVETFDPAPEISEVTEIEDAVLTVPKLIEVVDAAPMTEKAEVSLSARPNDRSSATAHTTPPANGGDRNNGKANGDLWSAIAPCWQSLADKDTLGATLKVSFSSSGVLSAPPEIERDPSMPINERTLRSEAKAISALSACGAYPMAQGMENVVVSFPAP